MPFKLGIRFVRAFRRGIQPQILGGLAVVLDKSRLPVLSGFDHVRNAPSLSALGRILHVSASVDLPTFDLFGNIGIGILSGQNQHGCSG
jgi:hypothetical protein